MPGQNLTRAEAAERAALISNVSYELDLDLTQGGGAPDAGRHADTFASTTLIRFDAAEPGADTWLDLIAPTVRRVTLNGRELDPAAVFVDSRIHLDDLQASNEVLVEADCAYMSSGEGLHRFTDPVDEHTYLYTQFEVADARRVIACFEQPDLKAPLTLTVTAPAHWTVVSNAATPEPQPLGDGTARWSFDPGPLLSPYLYAVCAGPYASVSDEFTGDYGTYPLRLFCRQSVAQHMDAEALFDVTKRGFAFFESEFEVGYPFGKYDQLFVPEFNAGAMENAGAVTFHEDYIFRSRVTDAAYEGRANTILHEMAHMWFGDLVTMRWWDDLWLNESFAEWASHWASVNATRFTSAWTTFSAQRKAWAYRQDQMPSTHPIAADMVDLDTVETNFDGITYAKGASALRQLVAFVGEPEFVAGLRQYFADHAWGNTTFDDLLSAVSASSGRDLSAWAGQWLQTSGVNTLSQRSQVNDEGRYTRFAVHQAPPSSPPGVAPTLRHHRLAIGAYDLSQDGLILRQRVELDVDGELTDVPDLVGQREPDLLLINDMDLTYAKIRLDERSRRTVVEHFGQLHSSLARTLIWSAGWDMTRDGELSTRDYVQLGISGLPSEREISVVQQTLRQIDAALSIYADPAAAEEYTPAYVATLEHLALTSEPGSDEQLAFVRALAAHATTPEQVGLVAGLLDGSRTLTGLSVDADLRWLLLHRLVVLGEAGEQQIAAELASDPTATGRRQAKLMRASIPTAAAKDAAWTEALNTTDLSNALLGATIAGINVPEHRELMRPHVQRYFDALETIWAERTDEMAQQITMGLYPQLLVEQETLDITDAYLAGEPKLPAGARRLLIEGRDSVARSMRARACDAADNG